MPEESQKNIQNIYEKRFREIVGSLNLAQSRAVKTIEGPVIVLAGPGTGKTHVLAARIGEILLQADVAPFNILCLTFTDAGVHAMRKRLLDFIGPEAHRVHIFSFHSFCNKIIQENLDLFGHYDLMPLSDVERIEILEQLIDQIPYESPLKKGKVYPYFFVKHLQALFILMKTENWSGAMLENEVKAYLSDLPNRDEFRYKRSYGSFKKGDLKEGIFKQEEHKMDLLLAGIELFPVYEEMLQEKKRYDYEDMILWVLKAFAEHPFLLRRYQEQYLYILVDEFQDTNGSQNDLLKVLTDYWSQPNLFIVGDDDQSIYEFQGARLRHLADFYKKYQPSLTQIILTDNYRSTQEILNHAGALIEFNTLRIDRFFKDVSKKLVSKTGKVGLLEVRAYPDRQQEYGGVFLEIRNLIQQGVPSESIAVLYARHKQADDLIRLFDREGLPYQTKRSVNLLKETPIIQLLTLLDYFSREWQAPFSGEALLVRILHFPFWGLHAADIGNLARFVNEENERSWRNTLLNPEIIRALDLMDTALFVQVGRFIGDYLDWGILQPISRLVEKVVNSSGLLAWLLEQENAGRSAQILNNFYRFIEEESAKNPGLPLQELLDLIDRMNQNNLSLPLQPRGGVEGGVLFSTAHSAKGLEFDYVFIIDSVADAWESARSAANTQFNLPDTLTYSREEDPLEARRRLFYVAVTRAKEHLVISYSNKKELDGKALTRSRFIDEFFSSPDADIPEVVLNDEAFSEVSRLFLQETKLPLITLSMEENAALLENFKLSISSLNSFLECPLAFYYVHLLKVPALPSEAALYGTAVHETLYRWFSKMVRSKEKEFPSVSFLEDEFEKRFRPARASLPQRAFIFRLDKGRKNLTALGNHFRETWHKDVWLELSINQVELNGVPLKGVVDKVERYPEGKVVLIDYKTGNPENRKFSKPSTSQPHGGSYWRQLLFYKVIFEQMQTHSLWVSEGKVLVVDPNSKGVFLEKSFSYDTADVAWMKDLILATWQKIINTSTYEGCGQPECPWCSLFEIRMLDQSLSDPSLEELDD